MLRFGWNCFLFWWRVMLEESSIDGKALIWLMFKFLDLKNPKLIDLEVSFRWKKLLEDSSIDEKVWFDWSLCVFSMKVTVKRILNWWKSLNWLVFKFLILLNETVRRILNWWKSILIFGNIFCLLNNISMIILKGHLNVLIAQSMFLNCFNK